MKRPDYTDQAQARDRAARHKRCVCGDRQPCVCTPSPGWLARCGLRPMFWRDFLLAVEVAVEAFQGVITPKLDQILKEMHTMSVNVDKLNADVQTLVAGYQAVVSERDALKSALASADADKAAAVADAVAAEDADAQAKIDAADAVVAAVNNPAPPADGGDVPPVEPVDGATA